MSITGRRVEARLLDNRAKLAAEWQALEALSDGSFFLSWTWIETWLESLVVTPVVLRVRAGDELLALGILVQRTTWRHGLLYSRQILLHEAGDQDLDRLAVEYNGFLARRDAPPELALEILDYLKGGLDWDECVMPGIRTNEMPPAGRAGLVVSLYRQSSCYALDLSETRQQRVTLFDGISRNARGQLRRALRLAEAAGPLSLVPAPDIDQALVYFEALTKLDRWAVKGPGGAFATPARAAFHRRLIARALPRGEVEILQARSGDKVLGYLYHFLYRGRVLSYQIGFHAPHDNRQHLGLVMHYLAIARATAQGHDIYDFLAGDARYKRSLGRATDTLVWALIQKPRLRFGLERQLRRLARWVRRR